MLWLDATTINDVIDMSIQPLQITTPLSFKILSLLKHTFIDLLQGFFMIANSFPYGQTLLVSAFKSYVIDFKQLSMSSKI